MMIQQAVFVVCRGTNNYFVTVFIEKHVIFIATESKIRNVLLLHGGYAGKRRSQKKNDREDGEDLKRVINCYSFIAILVYTIVNICARSSVG